MPPPIVTLEAFLAHLGVDAASPEAADASRLLDAISAEMRLLARRDFEGIGGTYDRILTIRGAREILLPHVPVVAIQSISRVYFDGTEDPAYAADTWRLEDPARGAVRLAFTADYIRVQWTTTGAIPAQIIQGAFSWGSSRWVERERDPGLAAYRTGDDSETYFPAIAGRPPTDVARAILGTQHATGGGPI